MNNTAPVKTVNGIAIYLTDEGKFTAEVPDGRRTKTVTRAALADIQKIIEQSAAKVVVRAIRVSLPYNNTDVRLIRLSGYTKALWKAENGDQVKPGYSESLLPFNADHFAELEALRGELERIHRRIREIIRNPVNVGQSGWERLVQAEKAAEEDNDNQA
jgi:hypothetical protein